MDIPEKPVQDGKIIIRFVGVRNLQVLSFDEIYSRDYTQASCYVVEALEQRYIYPWAMIYDIQEIYNSEEFKLANEKWSEAAHPLHTESAPDRQCILCHEIMHANSQPKIMGFGF